VVDGGGKKVHRTFTKREMEEVRRNLGPEKGARKTGGKDEKYVTKVNRAKVSKGGEKKLKRLNGEPARSGRPK